jgi:hypothetical protein
MAIAILGGTIRNQAVFILPRTAPQMFYRLQYWRRESNSRANPGNLRIQM